MGRARVVVGHTLASYCFPDSLVIDPIGLPPYPLRRVELKGNEFTLVPILVEECPAGAECARLRVAGVLKRGDPRRKACKDLKCQDPWPLRWLERDEWFLVRGLELERKGLRVSVSRVKGLDLSEGKLRLSGSKVVRFDELVWTAPYPVLAKLLGLAEPKRLVATVSFAEAECEDGIYFHFGEGNPIISIVCVEGAVISLAPGAVDGKEALKGLVRKGYLKGISNVSSYLIDYYALEETTVQQPEGVKLFGRTAQWKETPLEESLKCA